MAAPQGRWPLARRWEVGWTVDRPSLLPAAACRYTERLESLSAKVAELVDALGLGPSGVVPRASSSLAFRTSYLRGGQCKYRWSRARA